MSRHKTLLWAGGAVAACACALAVVALLLSSRTAPVSSPPIQVARGKGAAVVSAAATDHVAESSGEEVVEAEIDNVLAESATTAALGRFSDARMKEMKRRGLDPEIALCGTVAGLRKYYADLLANNLGGRRVDKYAYSLEWAAAETCVEQKGKPDWPEAMLYLGLTNEAVGRHQICPESEGKLGVEDLYTAALAASPPPSREIGIQLQYRAVLLEMLNQWSCFLPTTPEAFAGAKAMLQRLAAEDLTGLKTPNGGEIGASISTLAAACENPGTIATLRAQTVVAEELGRAPLAVPGLGNLEGSTEYYLRGAVGTDLRRYLADEGVAESDKAALRSQLSRLSAVLQTRLLPDKGQ